MQLLTAFLRLTRWPNLVFIAVTQLLFYFCIFRSDHVQLTESADVQNAANNTLFYILILASVVIAAAGNIINDYFDQKIDAINKPEKRIVGRYIKRRWAIVWHILLSVTGIALSAWVAYKTGIKTILILNSLTVLLLFLYSTTFKRSLLTGNIIIALLTAWVVGVVYVFTGEGFRVFNDATINQSLYFKLAIVYAGFSFITNLIREALKDMEDVEGDAIHGCHTMPIVWGLPVARVYTAVWLIVCIGVLAILLVYNLKSGTWLLSLYTVLFVIAPLMHLMSLLGKNPGKKDYGRMSNLMKFVMLAGILSMVFFYF